MIRSIGEHRRRWESSRDDARAASREPIGRFRATTTRDAHALQLDGECVYAMNDVRIGDADMALIEVMFADGTWILCEADEFVAL